MSPECTLPQVRYQTACRKSWALKLLHKHFTHGVFPGYTGNAGKDDPVFPQIGFIGSPLRTRNITVKNFSKIGGWTEDSRWGLSPFMGEEDARTSEWVLSDLPPPPHQGDVPQGLVLKSVITLARQQRFSNVLNQVLMSC